jgi:hypothetical protein
MGVPASFKLGELKLRDFGEDIENRRLQQKLIEQQNREKEYF